MPRLLIIGVLIFCAGCNVMKKLEDQVYIQQRTSMLQPLPVLDSLLIVANGNSATRRIMDDIIPLFQESLQKRGINSHRLFVSYTDGRINEDEFNNRNYTYTLWIYEQDRHLQQLDNDEHLVPLAIKLTDNSSDQNIWIATSIVNNLVKKKFYREKYAGTLALLFRANGLVK